MNSEILVDSFHSTTRFAECASRYQEIDRTIRVGINIAYRLTMDFFAGKVYLEFHPDKKERKAKSIKDRKNLLNFFTQNPLSSGLSRKIFVP